MHAVDLLEMREVLVKFHVSTNRVGSRSDRQKLCITARMYPYARPLSTLLMLRASVKFHVSTNKLEAGVTIRHLHT